MEGVVDEVRERERGDGGGPALLLLWEYRTSASSSWQPRRGGVWVWVILEGLQPGCVYSPCKIAKTPRGQKSVASTPRKKEMRARCYFWSRFHPPIYIYRLRGARVLSLSRRRDGRLFTSLKRLRQLMTGAFPSFLPTFLLTFYI